MKTACHRDVFSARFLTERLGQIITTGGRNPLTGGAIVPPVIQLKYALVDVHNAVFVEPHNVSGFARSRLEFEMLRAAESG